MRVSGRLRGAVLHVELDMTTVVVAEKPSVARDIARVLGVRKKGKGCLEGEGYVVTWALGHLVEFAEPDEYGPPWNDRWSFAQLPMIPDTWRLRTAKKTSAQYQIIKKLINDTTTAEVICATDAGREGENIFRLIYDHARCRKPVRRLWISSLTDEAISEGFRQLREGAAFDPLAAAARARSQADWLVGMNLTRAYTVHNKVLCTIGRVQTPTLAMIVRRDDQIGNFRKAIFYELVASLAEGFAARYSRDGQTRIDEKEEAERLHRELSPQQTGTVRKVEKKVRRNRPPALYDLNNLQRDANRRFGFTAAQTLKYAQALYETHKLISYPRTESRHISEDMVPELPAILEGLTDPQAPAALERLRGGLKLSRVYVDRNKLTDHHAILPTGQPPAANLAPELRRTYNLITTRFLAIFLPDQVVEETTVVLDIGGATFIARGKAVLETGWKIVEPARADAKPGMKSSRGRPTQRQNGPSGAEPTSPEVEDPEEEEERALPPLRRSQTVHVDGMDVEEKETRPPRAYTDATLLAAMKNAGRDIDDDALAEAMKESGLGTPATRAETIEKLIRTEYVQRERRQLRSTSKGQALIGLVAETLCSPELTAEWEQQLKDVEEGRLAAADYYHRIANFVRGLLPRVAQGPALASEQVAAAREQKPGRTGKKNKGKRGGGARGTDLGTCPLCDQGAIVETPKAYSCSRYREGCGFTIWKSMGRRKLPRKVVEQLIKEGGTEQLKGFKSKAGKEFAARLKMGAGGKVEFDFGDSTPRPAGPAGTPARRNAARPPTAQTASNADASTSGSAEWPLCPKCGRGRIIQGRRGYGCNRYREGCDFVVWQEISGKKLTENQVRTLIEKGTTRLIRGFAASSGEKFAARLHLDEHGRTILDVPDRN